MSKRRFEIVETELPKARILDKFTVGNEELKVSPEEQGSDTVFPKPDNTQSPNIAKTDDPVTKEEAETTPKPKPKPKPKSKQSKPDVQVDTQAASSVPTQAPPAEDPQDDEFFAVNFKVGVPVSLVTQYNKLKAKSTFSDDYLMNWLFSRSYKLMETINVAEMTIPPEGPKTVDPILSKRIYAKKSQLSLFREHHDPLEIYKIVDCCRVMYAAAFKEALIELAAKLKI